MTAITGSVKDVTGVEDNDTPWSFASVIRFAEDGSVITEKPREVRAVSGNLKVNLVPGYAIVTYGKHVWQVNVPETPTSLKALIEAGVAYPPDTPQALLDAAVGQYVETHREQFRTRAVPVVGDPTMAQWVDEYNNPVGDPVPWSEVVSDEVAYAAAEAQTPAAAEAFWALQAPQVVAGTEPDTVRQKFGDTYGPNFPAVMGLVDGLGDAGTVGKDVVKSETDADARAAIKALPSQPTLRTPSALACFTFDPGYTEDLTVIKPIFDAKGVKMGIAIVSDFIGSAGRLTWAQVKQLHDEGHEILSMGKTHPDLTALDEAAARAEINDLAAYTAEGITVNGYAYPFGDTTPLLRSIVRDYYDYGMSTSGSTHPEASGSQEPLSTYAIRRISLKDDSVTADHYAQIDAAIANGEIIAFISHSATELTGAGLTRLADVIQYCLDNDVPVVTPGEAVAAARNIFDVGDYPGGVRYGVISKSGAMYSAGGLPILPGGSGILTTVPSGYPEGVTIQRAQGATGTVTDSPRADLGAGTVRTTITGKGISSGAAPSGGTLNYQEFFGTDQSVWIRHANADNSAWGSWFRIDSAHVRAKASTELAVPPSSYAQGVTVSAVTGAGISGSPRADQGPGSVRTVIVDAGSGITSGTLNYQEFFGTNGGVWLRRASADNTSWGDWYKVSVAEGPRTWAPSANYHRGERVILPTGGLGYVGSSRTSGATWDSTERNFWNFLPGGHIETLTPGTTSWRAPFGISQIITADLEGAGAGGNGGGSATGSVNQVGGPGGAVGERTIKHAIAVTPGDTYTCAVGAVGTGGVGGAAGGDNPGTVGIKGGDTTLTIGSTTYQAKGGNVGAQSLGNSTTTVNAGGGGGGPTSTVFATTGIPGIGGHCTSSVGQATFPLSGHLGGGGGGPANSGTNRGGLGGGAKTTPATVLATTTAGGSADSNGGNGTTATEVGCGGGGGGGANNGGKGGDGGDGGPGRITLEF